MKKCQVIIDNEPFVFNVEGDFFWGKSELLFQQENNVISKTSWHNEGFSVVNGFVEQEFIQLKESIRTNVLRALNLNNIEVDKDSFKLEDYHKYVLTNEQHFKIIDITRNLTNDDFNFNIHQLTKKFGEILGYELTSWIKELQKSHIQIRISRPQSLDINPPHRDGYLSYWEDIINVWIPIAGCNHNSSLPVMPKSHLIPENDILRTNSKGAKINGNTYYVPCILETKNGDIEMIRPNPKEGEAIIFTPYLIHGSAINKNEDTTRVSLELRFPRVK